MKKAWLMKNAHACKKCQGTLKKEEKSAAYIFLPLFLSALALFIVFLNAIAL
jgi:hypothetical protein